MSTRKIRITVILAAVFCALLLGACAPKTNTAVFLYTNDTHTYLDGEGMSFASVAALKKELMKKGENVLLSVIRRKSTLQSSGTANGERISC